MASLEPARSPSRVSLTTVFTVSFGVVLVVALVFFLLRTRVSLTLALGSALAAVAMDHAVAALVRRGLKRSWAIVVVMGAVTALVVGMGLLLVPPIVAQVEALVAEAPALWQKLQVAPWFVRLDAALDLQERLRESGPAAMGALGGAVTVLAGFIACLFLAVFMLVFGRDLVTALLAQLRPASRESYQRMAAKIYHSVGGYLGGLLGICAINATLTTVFLVVLRIPFFLPLAILSGASSLLPYVGPLVVGAAITLFAFVAGGAWSGLAAAIYFVVYGQLEGNVLAPFIYRHTAHVNPLVTLLAILFLVEFMGIAGAVVAVPLAAAAQIIVAEIVALRREARLLLERQTPTSPPTSRPGTRRDPPELGANLKTDMRSENAARESVLTLLSDEEVARVSTAEAAGLQDGDEYLDLEHLAHGVRRAIGTTTPMGGVLPRKAVHERTWSKILAEVESPRIPTAYRGG